MPQTSGHHIKTVKVVLQALINTTSLQRAPVCARASLELIHLYFFVLHNLTPQASG